MEYKISENTRLKCIKMLKIYFSETDSKKIEKTIVLYTLNIIKNNVVKIKPIDMYRERFTEIYYALKKNSFTEKNGTIIDLIKENKLSYEDLSKKKIRDIYNLYKNETEIIAARKNQKITNEFSDLYLCPRCNKKEVIFTEVHKRSLDEGSTIVCRCVNCNYGFNR